MTRAQAFVRRRLALLLCAQTVGLVHRVLHALPGHASVASAAGVFGHEAGDNDCRLYDQLVHGDLAFGPGLPAIEPARMPAPAVAAPSTDTPSAGWTVANLSVIRRLTLGSDAALWYLKLDNLGNALACSASAVQTVRELAPLRCRGGG